MYVAFFSLSEAFEKHLVLSDYLPIIFRGNDSQSCNLGVGVVFRIISRRGFVHWLLLWEDFISRYQRSWFSVLLPIDYLFGSLLTCSVCVSEFLFFDRWCLVLIMR